MQIPVKSAIDRVPGGMMVVPLLLGALIATFFPDTPKTFGSFTGALFTGALSILAVFYVCMGASIDFKTTPYLLKKGGTLLSVKVGMAVVLGIIFGHFLGEGPVTRRPVHGHFCPCRRCGDERYKWRPLYGIDGSIRSAA